MKRLLFAICIVLATTFNPSLAQRKFVHPGISYTQADLDRMKAMVDARQEPFYSTFLQLKNGTYSSPTANVTQRGTQIKEGDFNGKIGIDGRRAHDLALLYHLTGEVRYADKAVEVLNANSHYINCSHRGTAPLDNGKINLLIEAAELLRDYPGWKAVDQQRFKDMLVYPGYSTTVNMNDANATIIDSLNNVTFYWNCYNFDAGRFGNQGMFAARGLLAMGVYLDNDTIFDRAFQYLNGTQQKHFENYQDLPYVPGPRVHSNTYDYSAYGVTASSTTNYQTIPNYGYDEQLQYYIHKNGQSQESNRDQGHTCCGIMMYVNIAEQCWNQGENLYGALDNRILKGIEYNFRVNVTGMSDYDTYCSDRDWDGQWLPVAWSVTKTKPAADWIPTDAQLAGNVEPESADTFYQVWSRSQRFFSKDLTVEDAGDVVGISGCREMAYAHYSVRMGMSDAEMPWLVRYRNYGLKKYGYEGWGTSGHHYTWGGWGTLTKSRKPYMVGDPCSYQSGDLQFGAHTVFDTVRCADFDYFTVCGNGHTYYNSDTSASSDIYRPGEQVGIEQDDDNYVVCHLTDGQWMDYSFVLPSDGEYSLSLRYAAGEASPMITVSVDGDEVGEIMTEDSYGNYVTSDLTGLQIKKGYHVFRLQIFGNDEALKLSTIYLDTDAETYGIEYDEGMSGTPCAFKGQVVRVSGSENVVPGSVIVYDPTGKVKLATSGEDDTVCSFVMPGNAVKVTCLNQPEDGVIHLVTCTNPASTGTTFARANHPDYIDVEIPATDSVYSKSVLVHPYCSHNYNRSNLRLRCPDGVEINVHNIYNQPWDVSGHVKFGAVNHFTLLNDHSNGIDFYANPAATQASLLSYIALSGKSATSIGELESESFGRFDSEQYYNLFGQPISTPQGEGVYIKGGKVILLHY